MSDSVALQLRRVTAAQHRTLESTLDLASPSLTFSKYSAVLTSFAMIYPVLECAIETTLTEYLQNELDWPARKKSGLLAEDLLALDLEFPPSLAANLPELGTSAAALGALYVIEGATLGGQYIVANARSLFDTGALNFFGSYGDQVITNWKLFKAVLANNVSQSGLSLNEAKAAAVATFATFISATEQ